jgi:CubicO group peptidase (beta-lactamase class C family)
MNAAIERLLTYQIDARHTPGALVHVERDGKVLARNAAGLLGPGSRTAMHEDALFRLASLTKPVVSLAALMQIDEGRLALDAPLADYLPLLRDLRLGNGIAPLRAPTLRDLLRHTSGLAYETEFREAALREIALKNDFGARMPFVDAADLLQGLAARPLAAEPGRAFRYGFSTDVLGRLSTGAWPRLSLATRPGMRASPVTACAAKTGRGWNAAAPAWCRRSTISPLLPACWPMAAAIVAGA